jgi:hypothetical protein
MVAVVKKTSSRHNITWLNLSGNTSDVVQKLADEGLTAKHVIGITYSTDGATARTLACRRE